MRRRTRPSAASRVAFVLHAGVLAGAMAGGGVLLATWRDGLSPLRLAVLAAIAAIAAIAALGVALPRRRADLAVLLVTLALGALAADQYFGRLAVTNPRARFALDQGLPFDTRWAPDVVLDQRHAGADGPIHPSITATNFHAAPLMVEGRPTLPLGQVAHSRIVLCNEGGEWVSVGSDRHGFINPDTVWDDDARTVVVGDSFAEGWCVPPGQSFADRLRAEFGPVRNLGRGSLGPLGELAVMREYLRGTRAAAVVWSFFEGNDWADLEAERKSPALAAYLDPAHRQDLMARRDAVQAALAAHSESYLAGYRWRAALPVGRWRANLGAVDLTALLPRRPAAVPTPAAPGEDDSLGVDWDHLRAVAALGVDEIRAAGAVPVFVLLPAFESYPQPDSRVAGRRARLLALMAGLGAVVVDGDAVFRAAGGDPRDLFHLRLSGHYTALGHRLVADAIAQALAARAGS